MYSFHLPMDLKKCLVYRCIYRKLPLCEYMNATFT